MKKLVKGLLVGVTTLSIVSMVYKKDYSLAQETTSTSMGMETKSKQNYEKDELKPFIGVWKNSKNQEISLSPRKFVFENKIIEIKEITFEEQEENKQAQLQFENSKYNLLDYNASSDTLNFEDVDYSREMNSNIINYVKDKISELQPLNLEQLLLVEDQYLMAYYHQAVIESDELEEQMYEIYLALAEDFPELELLTGEDYNEYQSLVSKLESASSYNFSILNKAVPRNILNYYNELKKDPTMDEQVIIQNLLTKVAEDIKAYEEREAKASQKYLLPYEWPEKKDQNTVKDKEEESTKVNLNEADPHLLKDSDYKLSDGIFSKEEAYTILVKATGYSIDYDNGYMDKEVGGYAFSFNGIIYHVFADGEINTSNGDVLNRNVEDQLTNEEDLSSLTVPEASKLFPNAVIKPFEPDIAFNYLLGKVELPSDAYFSDFYFNPTEGSYTLTISSQEKMRDPNYSVEDAIIAVYVVYHDGTFYKQ